MTRLVVSWMGFFSGSLASFYPDGVIVLCCAAGAVFFCATRRRPFATGLFGVALSYLVYVLGMRFTTAALCPGWYSYIITAGSLMSALVASVCAFWQGSRHQRRHGVLLADVFRSNEKQLFYLRLSSFILSNVTVLFALWVCSVMVVLLWMLNVFVTGFILCDYMRVYLSVDDQILYDYFSSLHRADAKSVCSFSPWKTAMITRLTALYGKNGAQAVSGAVEQAFLLTVCQNALQASIEETLQDKKARSNAICQFASSHLFPVLDKLIYFHDDEFLFFELYEDLIEALYKMGESISPHASRAALDSFSAREQACLLLHFFLIAYLFQVQQTIFNSKRLSSKLFRILAEAKLEDRLRLVDSPCFDRLADSIKFNSPDAWKGLSESPSPDDCFQETILRYFNEESRLI